MDFLPWHSVHTQHIRQPRVSECLEIPIGAGFRSSKKEYEYRQKILNLLELTTEV